MLSALVAAGIEGGYLTSPRLAMVHWQAGDRPLPAQRVTVSGESALWVDPAEIPSGSDIGKLGRALAAGRHGERDELMASTAAYSGLRWGELTALTIGQVDQAGRVITVDRQVIEVAGHRIRWQGWPGPLRARPRSSRAASRARPADRAVWPALSAGRRHLEVARPAAAAGEVGHRPASNHTGRARPAGRGAAGRAAGRRAWALFATGRGICGPAP
jgi:integrase